jgi:hypothetical protein
MHRDGGWRLRMDFGIGLLTDWSITIYWYLVYLLSLLYMTAVYLHK